MKQGVHQAAAHDDIPHTDGRFTRVVSLREAASGMDIGFTTVRNARGVSFRRKLPTISREMQC